MSIYLLNATRKVNRRELTAPMTRKQLFNMLLDYGAFKDSVILKFAVKNIIFEGFWNKLTSAYNSYHYDYKKVLKLNKLRTKSNLRLDILRR